MSTTASLQLAPEPVSVRAARVFVRDVLDGSERCQDCELLVSELATNAILHATSAFLIEVQYDGDIIRVDVIDESPRLPVVKAYAPDAITGRGLQIVDTVADRWGVDQSSIGKSVWFEIDARERDHRA